MEFKKQVIITFIITAYVGLIQIIPVNPKMQFYEQDTALSYNIVPDQFSTLEMTIISYLIPLILFIFHCVIDMFKTKKFTKVNLNIIYCLLLGLIQTMLINKGITDTIKLIAGRPRPIFFDLCDYQYFHTNRTYYYQMTSPNKLGDYSNCKSSTSDFYESVKSFPSGHASTSFAGMVYSMYLIQFSLAMYFARKRNNSNVYNNSNVDINNDNNINDNVDNNVDANTILSFSKLFSYLPLFISAWISITRIQDKKHNVEDVICGALIGSLVAHIVWRSISTMINLLLKLQKNNQDNLYIESLLPQ